MVRRFVLGPGPLAALAALAACYAQPAFDDPCAISCTDSCPGDFACGADHLCHAAGAADCMGSGSQIEPTHAYVDVQVGARSTCARDTGSAIYCWGDGGSDQLGVAGLASAVVPTRVGSAGDVWTALAVGADHACAIDPAKRVWCWGQNRDGASSGVAGGLVATPDTITFPQASPPPGFDTLSAGGFHTCAIGSGELWCWGLAQEVGVAGATTAVQIGSDDTWAAVSAGVDHSCAVTTSGAIECWGTNTQDQCGVDSGGAAIGAPVAVALPAAAPNVVSVTAGAQRTCAILAAATGATAGQLWCWGDNSTQLIAPGGAASLATPTRVGGEDDWTSIGPGRALMCGTRAGRLYCWGASAGGGLANGLWSSAAVAYDAMKSLGSADAVSVGRGAQSGGVDDTACQIASGAVACWGDNAHGAVGIGGVSAHVDAEVVAPPDADPGATWTAVFGGDRHVCATTNDDKLWCWGDDADGQVSATSGLGEAAPCVAGMPCDAPRPVLAPVSTAVEVSAGVDFTCALGSAGNVQCWGLGSAGQLGSASQAHAPVTVSGTFAHLLGGDTAMCGQTTTGAGTLCWGAVPFQTPSTPTAPAAPAATGMAQFSFGAGWGCGIPSGGGQRVCWGLDMNDAQGIGAGAPTVTAPALAGSTQFTQITASENHGCGVTTAGNVACWGENFHEQCAVGGANVPAPQVVMMGATTLASCQKVEQSPLVSCALCGGAVVCWGEQNTGSVQGTTGEPAVPRPITTSAVHTYKDVAVRAEGGCALDTDGVLLCWGASLHGENGDGGHAVNVPTAIAGPVAP